MTNYIFFAWIDTYKVRHKHDESNIDLPPRLVTRGLFIAIHLTYYR